MGMYMEKQCPHVRVSKQIYFPLNFRQRKQALCSLSCDESHRNSLLISEVTSTRTPRAWHAGESQCSWEDSELRPRSWGQREKGRPIFLRGRDQTLST